MQLWLSTLAQHAAASPDTIALRQWQDDGGNVAMTYSSLWEQVTAAAAFYRARGVSQVGLVMSNSPAWVITDLALLLAGVTSVPVPLTFTETQAHSLLRHCDLVVCDLQGEDHISTWLQPPSLRVDFAGTITHPGQLSLQVLDSDWICKVIHTSGTTNAPKGVRIRAHGLECLVTELLRHVEGTSWQHYLSLVPLSLLIEQVTGIYMTLSRGGCISFLPVNLPLLGTSVVPAAEYWSWVCRTVPDALVLTPGMVQALAHQLHGLNTAGVCKTDAERNCLLFGSEVVPFIACGGGAVSRDALASLLESGIPVYEGYGLSENSSVVSWNSPRHFRPGTAGKPLAHVQLKRTAEGELLLRSDSLFAGYLGTDPTACEWDEDGWLNTGDIADTDSDGFVTIRGRRKHVIITASSRNISPEWVEGRYRELPFVEDVCLFGEGLNELWGVFFIRAADERRHAALAAEIRHFGQHHLSSIDRVDQIILKTVFEADRADWFTVTGRPRRQKIAADLLVPVLENSTPQSEVTL